MENYNKIIQHQFCQAILFGDIESNLNGSVEDYSEIEYYVHGAMFYTTHLMSLFNQLENAIGLLTNFRFNPKDKISRADHLTYNVENYMIRVISISDRLLQVINSIYYLKLDEKKVKYNIVFKDGKISSTKIPQYFEELKNILDEYRTDRNYVVHQHSYISVDIHRIQKLYDTILTEKYAARESPEEFENFKQIRKLALKTLTSKLKEEFNKTNEKCGQKICLIFDILNTEYESKKKELM